MAAPLIDFQYLADLDVLAEGSEMVREIMAGAAFGGAIKEEIRPGANLTVRGVDGLRVADASIMPSITGGNTNAASIMLLDRITSGRLQWWRLWKLTEVYTGEVITTLPQSSPEDIENAFARARNAQAIWSQCSVKERMAVFKRFHQLLLERRAARSSGSCRHLRHARRLLRDLRPGRGAAPLLDRGRSGRPGQRHRLRAERERVGHRPR